MTTKRKELYPLLDDLKQAIQGAGGDMQYMYVNSSKSATVCFYYEDTAINRGKDYCLIYVHPKKFRRGFRIEFKPIPIKLVEAIQEVL